MPQFLRCPHGHQWGNDAGPHSPAPASQAVCPVCGGPAVGAVEESEPTAADGTVVMQSVSLPGAAPPAVAPGGAAVVDQTLMLSDEPSQPGGDSGGPPSPSAAFAPEEDATTRLAVVRLSGAAPAEEPGAQDTLLGEGLVPGTSAPAQDDCTSILPSPEPPSPLSTLVEAGGDEAPGGSHPPLAGEPPTPHVPDTFVMPSPSIPPAPGRSAETGDKTSLLSGMSPADSATGVLGPDGSASPSEAAETRISPDEPPPGSVAERGRALQVPGYEILGELGRGGMGVVYLARQISLHRLVALKMIRAGAHAGSEDLARFFIEAEVIARLRHPHIVQIYQVGEHDGQPYCALEYVEGGSLHEKLNGTPMPARQAGELLEAIARAMHAAHELGIIHRDLKPANVLLTKEGTPKVTDFGLAKQLDEEAGSAQTRTGTIMGTPSYMAPEQALGKTRDIGPPADVYALGALLYDVLTGRPPFKGETALDTLQLVHSTEPVPPTRMQPKVPRDLETICLKCLEKEPPRRYATAQALADDLRRFLNHEPIQARPVSALERARKWARRKPAIAAVVALSTLLVLGLIAGGFVVAGLERHRADEEQRLRGEAETARNKAEREKERADNEAGEAMRQKGAAEKATAQAKQQGRRAEKNFQKARAAVDQMLTRVGKERLAHEPRMEKIRRDLLTRALQFYEGFLQEKGDDPGLRQDTGRAHHRVGDIQEMLGQYAAAGKAYQAAAGLFVELTKEFPDQPEHRQDLAAAHNGLAIVLQASGRRDEAAEEFQNALKIQEELATTFPEQHQYKRDLAASFHNRANLLQTQNRLKEAEQAYGEAIARLGRLADQFPDQPDYRHELGRAHSSLGVLLLNTRQGNAGKAFDRALELQEPLVKRYAHVAEYRHELARTLSNRGNWLQGQKQLPEADRSYSRAEVLFDPLVKEFSGVPDYKHELANCLKNHGELLRITPRRSQDAEPLLNRAVALYLELAKDHPETPVYRQGLAQSYHNLGVLLRDLKQYGDAKEAHGGARTVRQQLVDDFPREPAYRRELAYSHGELAIVLAETGRHPQSKESFERGIALLAKLEEENPREPAYWGEQIIQHENLILLLSSQGWLREAEKSSLRVVVLREKLAETFADVAAHRSNLGQSLHRLAGLLLEQHKPAEARKYLREAIRQQQKALTIDPQPAYRQALCLHYLGLVEVAFSTGDHAEAAQTVAELVKAVPAEVADYPRCAGFLARCVTLAGKDEALPEARRKELARAYGDQALDLLRKAIARGYKDAAYLRQSRDMEPLRSRDDFKEVLSDLEARTKPAPR